MYRTLVLVCSFIFIELCFADEKLIGLQMKVDNTQWMSEDFPPYHYVENGAIQGLAIDIINDLFKRNKLRLNNDQIVMYPWARALKILSNNKNAAVITMGYTEERDSLYRLSEALFEKKVALITRSTSEITSFELEDLSDFVVGVVRDDIGERLIKDMGPSRLRLTHVFSSYELLQMLLKGRVDMIAYSQDIIAFQLSKAGIATTELRSLMVLSELKSSLAFNREVDAELFSLINQSIIDMKTDGTIARILAAHQVDSNF